ncbi:hypothetical protein KFE96_13140 [Kordiimonas sp. SCSIO 12603]|uniref:hypothetical protein n=1 Tax=Kordiimonas sp. SCSIO 12603 TaxID=2829596 RepID=UPI002102AE63|nr:hypothetical protein [Kordiimonas sp. SCSIO 12603]UTW57770.1 hypothetical protein KFE96_13140 [Kordiimonas sp. SCSIO 12603]
MDLDDMKKAWDAQNTQLEKSMRLNAELISSLKKEKLEKSAFGLQIEPWFDIIFGVIVVFLMGSFIGSDDFIGSYKFPAILLHIGGIVMIIAGAYQLTHISKFDFSAPVTELQERVVKLKRFQLRFITGVFCLSPIIGVSILLVVAKGIFGADIMPHLPSDWLWVNIGLATTASITAIYASRKYGKFLAENSVMKKIADGLAGSRFKKMEEQLSELESFKSL